MSLRPKNVHVVPITSTFGGWAVRLEGDKAVYSIHHTQGKAIEVAIALAEKEFSEVVIHGEDGRIRDKDSYGNDPKGSKDKVH